MGDMTEPLRTLFQNAETIIRELGKEFTFEQFRKRATQQNQEAYIDLLVAARGSHEKLFGFAHQQLGARLKQVAESLGYERVEEGYTEDIFGNPTKNVIYRRTK